MKKFLILISILSLTGCKERIVFHSYYGDFDTDTMEVAFVRDGMDWYQVHYVDKDSFCWDGEWRYLKGPIIDYYCPESNTYEETFPDNQGRRIVVEIDPYHRDDWLK